MQFCQVDSCRLGGVNEVLAVYLMAKKFGVPVCPHAGGVGLCEYVQHLASGTTLPAELPSKTGCSNTWTISTSISSIPFRFVMAGICRRSGRVQH